VNTDTNPDTPQEAPLLQVRDVTRVYDLGEITVEALQPTSFDIYRGEYVALMGPSGSGKSTLMNTLGCLDRPSGGSYVLDGEETADLSSDQRARIRNRQIGFVFQNFNLLNRTSALENVEVPLLYAKHISAHERRERAVEVLNSVGLGDRLKHYTSQLSGGQQQRVAIARALINRPSILLADEPTGNLDTRTSDEVIHMFEQLNEEQGLTVIVVTHNEEIARNAKRVIVLRDGRVITDTVDIAQALESLHSYVPAEAES